MMRSNVKRPPIKNAPYNSTTKKITTKKKYSDDLMKYYRCGKLLFKGVNYELVSAVKLDSPKQERCIKCVRKYTDDNLANDAEYEYGMLRQLSHPNIAKVFEIYEDDNYFYIVTELLKGENLFKTLAGDGKLDEAKCADIIKQLLDALAYLQTSQIIHRDIRPQNIIIENNSGKPLVKLINFDICKSTKGKSITEMAGTPLFMAPEVIQKMQYDTKADIWSVGVMTLVILTGMSPFSGKTNEELFHSICKTTLTESSFNSLNFLSNDTVDFILKCLNPNPKERSDAKSLSKHPWINSVNRSEIPSDVSANIKKNLTSFNKKMGLEKAVFQYLTLNAANFEDKKALNEMFVALDKSGDGKISKSEFIVGMLNNSKTPWSYRELEEMFESADVDKSGSINYNEFLNAAINKQRLYTDDKLKVAFEHFDLDGNGVITKDEIYCIMESDTGMDDSLKDALMSEIRNNKNSAITFSDFKAMMLKEMLGSATY